METLIRDVALPAAEHKTGKDFRALHFSLRVRQSLRRAGDWIMKRSLLLALTLGMTATIGFCLAVWIRNLVYQSTLSWRIPLNVFTFPGLLASALIFPCQKQGLETGCEWYRTFPMFVTVNSLSLTVISLPLVHLFRIFRMKG